MCQLTGVELMSHLFLNLEIINYLQISKVMEICVHNQLFNHISSELYNYQHGFIKGKSTCTQLLQFSDDIGRTLNATGKTDVLYLDFAKAFDKVSHELLLYKLHSMYGIGGNLLRWFKSYLSDRYQRVLIDGSHSDWLPVTSGEPQGSILGQLLFLLYINDLHAIKHKT
jgi:hypothetical protein